MSQNIELNKRTEKEENQKKNLLQKKLLMKNQLVKIVVEMVM